MGIFFSGSHNNSIQNQQKYEKIDLRRSLKLTGSTIKFGKNKPIGV